ncbi:hypothetical protein K7G98_38270, partial [Saccharothrix sp. MB29]|nr:hypothetical protein [Saccharothrix sp. MB29]
RVIAGPQRPQQLAGGQHLVGLQQQQAEGGALPSGEPARATKVLREALSMWRGSVLADLVESGVNWPELTAVQHSRLDAMENLFEAELACGRHHAVLGPLQTMVET